MNKQAVIEAIGTVQKGANIVLEWTRNGKVLKTFQQFEGRIQKSVHFAGRIGINYDNINNVIEKRENGDIPKDNAGLRGDQVWAVYPYLIYNPKNDKYHLRIYKGIGDSTPKVQWYLDGNPIAEKILGAMKVLQSGQIKTEEQKKEREDFDCFQVPIDAITQIGKVSMEVEQETTPMPIEKVVELVES